MAGNVFLAHGSSCQLATVMVVNPSVTIDPIFTRNLYLIPNSTVLSCFAYSSEPNTLLDNSPHDYK